MPQPLDLTGTILDRLSPVHVRVTGNYEVQVDVGNQAMSGQPQAARSRSTSPVSLANDRPIFRLPQFTVEAQFLTLAETVDWGLAMMHVPKLWKQTQGEGIRVGVCDTGCDLLHTDLEGAVVAAADFTGSRFGAADKNGHGTHCAGIIAARHNQIGIAGVAPRAQLVVAKVLGDNGSGDGAGVAAGIDYCRDQQCKIISMSLGAPQPDEQIMRAVQRAVDAGVLVIMAAGNEGPVVDRQGNALDSVNFPARWRQGIAVGAVDRNGQVARFSSRGPEVDIAAPGQDVTSTWPGGGYAKLSGTSMATPFVAGVVALLLARNLQPGVKSPVRDMASLKAHLASTAKDAGPQGKDPAYGYGLIDPASMLNRVETQPPGQSESSGVVIELPLLGKVVLHTPAVAGDLFSIRRG